MADSNKSISKQSPVFFDVESSSLWGAPVEIGFAWWDGNKTQSESHLILPDPGWNIEVNWDAQAEALHRISLVHLMENGKPAFNVARRMNEKLAGRELFADSPYDFGWIGQLFTAADLEPTFHVRRMLAAVLIEQHRIRLGLSESDVERIAENVKREFPHTHRAEADSVQWAELWQAISTFKPVANS